jgi:hypothetical protein
MEQSEIPGVFTAQITISTVSEWGMQIFIDDQWTNKFGGENGKLVFNSATNITDDQFIPAGTYTLVVNLVNNTYYIVGEQLYVVGLNDVWDFSSAVLNMTEPGIFSGNVSLTGSTPWGYYFLLYPDNWDVKIGGSNDALLFGGENIEADWYATMGTYTVTVDLINEICTVE